MTPYGNGKYQAFVVQFGSAPNQIPVGMRALASRLIRGAVEDYLTRRGRTRSYAEYWLFTDTGAYTERGYMSFEFACQMVEIDPGRCRKTVLSMEQRRRR